MSAEGARNRLSDNDKRMEQVGRYSHGSARPACLARSIPCKPSYGCPRKVYSHYDNTPKIDNSLCLQRAPEMDTRLPLKHADWSQTAPKPTKFVHESREGAGLCGKARWMRVVMHVAMRKRNLSLLPRWSGGTWCRADDVTVRFLICNTSMNGVRSETGGQNDGMGVSHHE